MITCERLSLGETRGRYEGLSKVTANCSYVYQIAFYRDFIEWLTRASLVSDVFDVSKTF